MPISKLQSEILMVIAQGRDAESFVAGLTTDAIGTVYLDEGEPVMPDPERLDTYAINQLPGMDGNRPMTAKPPRPSG